MALEMWPSPRRISLRAQSLLLRGHLRPEVPGVSQSLGRIAITVIPCEVEIATLGWEMAVGALLRNWGLFFLWRSWIPVFGQFQSAGPRPTCLHVEKVGGIQWVRGGEQAVTPSQQSGGCDSRSSYCYALPGICSPLIHGGSLSPDSHSSDRWRPCEQFRSGEWVSRGKGPAASLPFFLSLDS